MSETRRSRMGRGAVAAILGLLVCSAVLPSMFGAGLDVDEAYDLTLTTGTVDQAALPELRCYPVFGINLAAEGSPKRVKSITLRVWGGGALDGDRPVIVYQDNGDEEGSFDNNDEEAPGWSTYTWRGGGVDEFDYLTIAADSPATYLIIPQDDIGENAGIDFYLCPRTSSAAAHGQGFRFALYPTQEDPLDGIEILNDMDDHVAYGSPPDEADEESYTLLWTESLAYAPFQEDYLWWVGDKICWKDREKGTNKLFQWDYQDTDNPTKFNEPIFIDFVRDTEASWLVYNWDDIPDTIIDMDGSSSVKNPNDTNPPRAGLAVKPGSPLLNFNETDEVFMDATESYVWQEKTGIDIWRDTTGVLGEYEATDAKVYSGILWTTVAGAEGYQFNLCYRTAADTEFWIDRDNDGLGRVEVYDDGIDLQVWAGTNLVWNTVHGDGGNPATDNAYYYRYQYDPQDTAIVDIATGTSIPNRTAGFKLIAGRNSYVALSYYRFHDKNNDIAYNDGEDIVKVGDEVDMNYFGDEILFDPDENLVPGDGAAIDYTTGGIREADREMQGKLGYWDYRFSPPGVVDQYDFLDTQTDPDVVTETLVYLGEEDPPYFSYTRDTVVIGDVLPEDEFQRTIDRDDDVWFWDHLQGGAEGGTAGEWDVNEPIWIEVDHDQTQPEHDQAVWDDPDPDTGIEDKLVYDTYPVPDPCPLVNQIGNVHIYPGEVTLPLDLDQYVLTGDALEWFDYRDRTCWSDFRIDAAHGGKDTELRHTGIADYDVDWSDMDTLVDYEAGWNDDWHNGYLVEITSGAAAGQVRTILDTVQAGGSNPPYLIVSQDWDMMIPDGSQYKIYSASTLGNTLVWDTGEPIWVDDGNAVFDEIVETGTCEAATTYNLVDVDKRWRLNRWDNLQVTRDPGGADEVQIIRETTFKRDWGTVGTATNNTMTDTTKAWAVGEWDGAGAYGLGYFLVITEGKGAGQMRDITGTTADTLTVGSDWTVSPNNTSSYIIVDPIENDTATLGTSGTLVDNDESWVFDSGVADADSSLVNLEDDGQGWGADALIDCVVIITSGSGKGQIREIATNDADTITVDTPFDTAPDDSSTYEVYQHAERYVMIVEGTGAGQIRRIKSNNATRLTLYGNWDVLPDGSSDYIIVQVDTLIVTTPWEGSPVGEVYNIGDNIIYDPLNLLYDGYGTTGQPTMYLYCYVAGDLAFLDLNQTHKYEYGEHIVRVNKEIDDPVYEGDAEQVTSEILIEMAEGGYIRIQDACTNAIPEHQRHLFVMPDTGTFTDGDGHDSFGERGGAGLGGEAYTELRPCFSVVELFDVRLGGRAATASGNVNWDWFQYGFPHRGNAMNDDNDFFDLINNVVYQPGPWGPPPLVFLPLVDEEFRDGIDNDGDGRVDEDCGDYAFPHIYSPDLTAFDFYHIYVYHDNGDGQFDGADAQVAKFPNYTDSPNPTGFVPLHSVVDIEDGGMGATLGQTVPESLYFVVLNIADAGDTAVVEYGLDFGAEMSLYDLHIGICGSGHTAVVRVRATNVPGATFPYQGRPYSRCGEEIYAHYDDNLDPDVPDLLTGNSFLSGIPEAVCIAEVEYVGHENERAERQAFKPTCVCRGGIDIQVLDAECSTTPFLGINVTDTPGGDEKLESLEVYFAPFTIPNEESSGSTRGLRGVVVTPTAVAGKYTIAVDTSQYGHFLCCPYIVWDDPPQVAFWYTVTHPDGVTVDYGMCEIDYDEEHSDRNHCGKGDVTDNPERNLDFVTSDGGIIIPYRNWIDPLNAQANANATWVIDTTRADLVSMFDPNIDLMPLADDETSGIAIYETIKEGMQTSIWSLTQGIVDETLNQVVPISVEESEWIPETHPTLAHHTIYRLYLKPNDGLNMPDDDDAFPEYVLALRTARSARYNAGWVAYVPDDAFEFTHNIAPGTGVDRRGPRHGTPPTPPALGWVTFFKTGKCTPTHIINPPTFLTNLTEAQHKIPSNSPPVPVIGINTRDDEGLWPGESGFLQRLSVIVLRFDQVYEFEGEALWLEDPDLEDGLFNAREDLHVYGVQPETSTAGTVFPQPIYFQDEDGDGIWDYERFEAAWTPDANYTVGSSTLLWANGTKPLDGTPGIQVDFPTYFYDEDGDGVWDELVRDEDFTYNDLKDLKRGDVADGVDAYTSGVHLYRDMPGSDNIGAFDDPTDPNVVVSDEIVPMQDGYPRWSSMIWDGWPHTLVMRPEMGAVENPNYIAASVLNNLPDDDSGTDAGDDYFIVVRTSGNITHGDDFRVHLGTNSQVAYPGIARRWLMTDVNAQNAIEFLPHPIYPVLFQWCPPAPPSYFASLYMGRFTFKRITSGEITNSTITTTVYSDKIAQGQKADASSSPIPAVGISVYDNPGSLETIDGVRVYFEDMSKKADPRNPFGGVRIIYVSPGTDLSVDDDLDGEVDEDPADGVDNDGDGATDEDGPEKTLEYEFVAGAGNLTWDGGTAVALGLNVKDDSDLATTYQILQPAGAVGDWNPDWQPCYAIDDGTGSYTSAQAVIVVQDDSTPVLDSDTVIVREGTAALMNFTGSDNVLFDNVNGIQPGESDWDPEEDVWLDANGNGRYDVGEALLYVGQATNVLANQRGLRITQDEPGHADLAYLDSDHDGAYDLGEPIVNVTEGGVSDDSNLLTSFVFLDPGPSVPLGRWSPDWFSCYVVDDDETDNDEFDATEAIVQDVDMDNLMTAADTVVDSGQADLTLFDMADGVFFNDASGNGKWDSGEAIWHGDANYGAGDDLLYGNDPGAVVGLSITLTKQIVYLDSNHDGIYGDGASYNEPLIRAVAGGTYTLSAGDGEYIIVWVDPTLLPSSDTQEDITILPSDTFDPSVDLATLTTDVLSGVSLYRDEDTGLVNGQLDANDALVAIGQPVWAEDSNGYYVDLVPKSGENVPDDDNGSNDGADYFVAVRTSDSIDYRDAFRLKVYWNGVTYSSGSSTANGNLATNWIEANVPTYLTDVGGAFGHKVTPASEPMSVIGLSCRDKGIENALNSITVFFYNVGGDSGFTAGDLMPLSKTQSSGVALYRDNPYGGENGILDPLDIFLPLRVTPAWGGGLQRRTVTLLVADAGAPGLFDNAPVPDIDDGNDSGPDYFVTITTSPSISHGDDFQVGIIRDGVIDGVNYTDGWSGERITGATITCDLGTNQAPTIAITLPAAEGSVTSPGTKFQIEWTDSDPEENAQITLFYDTDDTGLNGVQIETAISEDPDSGINEDRWNDTLVDEDPRGDASGDKAPGYLGVDDDEDGGVDFNDVNVAYADYDGDGTRFYGANKIMESDENGPGGDDDPEDWALAVKDDDEDGEADEDGGDFYMWDTSGLQPGSYWIYAKIDDGLHDPVYAYSEGPVVLNYAPSITMLEPSIDEIAVGTFKIEWQDEDIDNNAEVRLYYDQNNIGYDGVLITTTPLLEDNPEDEYDWDVTQVASGEYYIYGEIDDGLNPKAYSYSTGRVIVRRRPDIVINAPLPDEVVRGTYAIQYSASDADPGQTDSLTITLSYRSVSGSWTPVVDESGTPATGVENSGTYSWVTPASANGGQYLLRAVATDTDGYTDTYITEIFTIDNVEYEIRGTVTLTGVTSPNYGSVAITVDSDEGQVTFNASNGTYMITSLPPGARVVSVAAPGYVFEPSSRVVDVGPSYPNPRTGVNFTGYALAIEGTVTLDGEVDHSGVKVSVDTGEYTLTDSAGAYTIAPVTEGTHTVSAQKSGYVFAPVERTVVVPPSQTDEDFTGYRVLGEIISIEKIARADGMYPFDVRITWESTATLPNNWTYTLVVSDTVDGLSVATARTSIPFSTPADGSMSWTDDGQDVGTHPSLRQARYYAIMVSESIVSEVVGICELTLTRGTNYICVPLEPLGDASFDTLMGDQLTGGATATTSDKIMRWHRSSSSFSTAWLNTATGLWQAASDSTGMNLNFRRDEGLRVDVVNGSQVTVSFVGIAGGLEDIDLTVLAGLNLVGVTYHENMRSTWTSESTLDRFPLEDLLTGGASEGAADRLWFWDGDDFEFAWLVDTAGAAPAIDGMWYADNLPREVVYEAGKAYWVEKRGGNVPVQGTFPNSVHVARIADVIQGPTGSDLAGNGTATSCMVQVLWTGPDGAADPASGSATATDDDVALVRATDTTTHNARIGHGFPTDELPTSGTGLFADDFDLRSAGGKLPSGAVLYFRVWNAATPSKATAYADSATFTLDSIDVNVDGVAIGAWNTHNPAPSEVTNLQASPLGADGVGKVMLTWVNPTEEDFAGLVIVRGTDESGLTRPHDGTLAVVGDMIGAGKVVGVLPAGVTSFTDSDPNLLTDGTRYYYKVHTFDTGLAHSDGVVVSSVAQDNAPVFIRVIENVTGEINRPLMVDVAGAARDDVDEYLEWAVEGEDFCQSFVTGDVIWFQPDRDFRGKDTVTLIVYDSKGHEASVDVVLQWVDADLVEGDDGQSIGQPIIGGGGGGGGGGGCFLSTASKKMRILK